MTSIRAFSEILRDTEAMGAIEKAKYASIIHAEAIRLTRLLDDLLELSVLEHGQVGLNVQQGSLADILDQAVTSAMAGERDSLSINRVPSDETLSLTTDLDRLSQVFINLVANAHKYCDAEKPELTILVTQTSGSLNVDFTDNGTGIPKESQTLIFEKFARVNNEKGKGAGLGLAISREIMHRLEGDITYRPGKKGTGFRVRLPQSLALAAQ
jgi:signal transduction histidine kinase